jgi:hypothetical protein
MKKLIIFTILLLSVTNLIPWFDCRGFKDDFHFSKYKVSDQLDDAIHNDTNLSFGLIRIYHNKPLFYLLNVVKRLYLFLDLNLTVNLVSIAGTAGLLSGVYYCLKERKSRKVLMIILIYLMIFLLAEIISSSKMFYPLKLIIFTLPYHLLSYLGYQNITRGKSVKKGLIIILVILVCVSVWWQATLLDQEVFNYCSEVLIPLITFA